MNNFSTELQTISKSIQNFRVKNWLNKRTQKLFNFKWDAEKDSTEIKLRKNKYESGDKLKIKTGKIQWNL